MKSHPYLLECCRAGYLAAGHGQRKSPHIPTSDADFAWRAGAWLFARGLVAPHACAKGRGHRIRIGETLTLHFGSNSDPSVVYGVTSASLLSESA